MLRAPNLITGIVLLFISAGLCAQPYQVGSIADIAARSSQLRGKLDSSISFTVRPVNPVSSPTNIYSVIDSNGVAYQKPIYFAGKYGRSGFLPFTIIQQFNTHHPYGWNDGAMIAAKGYQVLISAGIYAGLGPLEIQLQPELVYTANSHFENNSNYGNQATGSYQKLFPGQSSIRLSAWSMSLGVSTENLWWGPGRHSSLLMSNNAPGFVHVFFSTSKPLRTAIGSFEWQLIGGRLTSSNSLAYENYNLKQVQLTNASRYLNAYVLSYQPKWTPGLFLGMTRGLQMYHKDIQHSFGSVFSKYFSVLTKAVQKSNAQNDDSLHTDQLASFFVRWALAKEHAEFYIEYGFNDYNQNVRDYVMGPSHSAAYIVGFKKIFPLKQNSYLDFGFEMTQMSQSPDHLIRDAGNWYVHSEILQGYTHENQILGAGAGLGCNVQSLTTTWVNGWKQWGLILERVERDPIYHPDKWIDYSIGIMPQWKKKNIVFSGLIQFINSSNYAWENNMNRFNLHSKLSIQYLL
jgi:hypothetical protein